MTPYSLRLNLSSQIRTVLLTGFTLSPLVLAVQQVYASDALVSDSISKHYRPLSELDEPTRNAFLKERPHCSGAWVQPHKQNTHKPASTTTAQDPPITAKADSAYFSPDHVGSLYGNVTLVQGDKTVNADQIDIDLTTNIATAKGNIALSDGDIYSQTNELSYNLKSKDSHVATSHFFSEKRQAHGMAGNIEQTKVGAVSLDDVTYSTCAPTDKKPNGNQSAKSWEIQAKNITLDEQSGRGQAKNARLLLMGIPTLYLPYLDFPIDDRRMSGFLTPRLGFNNDGGLDLSVPYYFNLANNYDMTLTPRILFGRGGMLEGEFRYLSDGYGQAKVEGGLLPKDDNYNGKSREYLKAKHEWDISRRFKSSAEFNYVSDKDYFNDLGTNPLVQDELNLPRNIILDYTDDKRELEGKIKVETFQTVDKTLPDADKPYSRLPQLTATYHRGNPLGLMTDVSVDFGYFSKQIDDDAELEDSGARYYAKVGASYNFVKPWGYIKPAFTVEELFTVFDELSFDKQDIIRTKSNSVSVTLPSITIDSAMVFESHDVSFGGLIEKNKTRGMTQTIEPRLFYSYAPFKDQTSLPNFDTTTASLSYDQLFTNKRFLGHDRLADSNALSLGINYRLFDRTGLERFNLGVGNRFNFNNQQVQISGEQAKIPDTSGPVARLQGYITPKLRMNSDFALTDNGKNNFHATQLSWQPKERTLLNLGYFDRKQNKVDNQQRLKQATASFEIPLNQQWNLMGHTQYDLSIDKNRDLLVGASYESCCYGVAFYGRHYYNNLDNPLTTQPKRQFMLELSLKGLAGVSGGLTNLLEQKVIGYGRFNRKLELNNGQ